MAKKGKKYVEAAKLVDRSKAYDVSEAVALVKKTNTAKFDATVEGVLPVPFGSTTAPRICWSFLRGSTPKRKATSTVASNLAVFVFLTRATASETS